MKLSVKALALTGGIFLGGTMFLVGLANLIWPGYGTACLQIADSIYPGYHYGGGFGSVIVGTLYGVVDGTIGGAILAFLYNLFAPKSATTN